MAVWALLCGIAHAAILTPRRRVLDVSRMIADTNLHLHGRIGLL